MPNDDDGVVVDDGGGDGDEDEDKEVERVDSDAKVARALIINVTLVLV